MRPILLTLILCTGCGAAPAAVEKPDADGIDPRRLYPLKKGNAWSYDVDLGDGESVLAVTRVVTSDADRAEVLTGNQQTVRYEFKAQGIFRPSTGTWLLKGPVRKGMQWPSASGMTARVTATDAKVKTADGELSGCVRIEESGGPSGREVSTVYCPGVGPAYVESRISVRGRVVSVIARLRGHRVDK